MTDWKLLTVQRSPSANCEHEEQTDMALFVNRDRIMSSRQDYQSQALSGVELASVPQKITQAWANSQSPQRQHKAHPVTCGCLPKKNQERCSTDVSGEGKTCGEDDNDSPYQCYQG